MSYWTVCGTSNEHRLNTQTHTQNSIGIKALSALILSTLNLVRLTTQTVVANLTVHAADSKRLTGLLSQIKKKLWGNPSPIYIVRKKAHVALQHMLRPGIYAWNLKKTHTHDKNSTKKEAATMQRTSKATYEWRCFLNLRGDVMPAAVCFPAMVYEEQCHCVGAFIITVMTNNFRLQLQLQLCG